MAITLNNVTFPAGYIADDDDSLTGPSISTDDVSTSSITISGTLSWNTTTKTGSAVTVVGTLPDGSTNKTLYAAPYDNGNFVFVTDNPDPTKASFKYILSNVRLKEDTTYTATRDTGLTKYSANPPCFVTGTRIRVVRDGVQANVVVENVRVGDCAVTASGAVRPVVWIGHNTIDCRRHRLPQDVMPVRVSAHAFGDGVPERDLTLSPGHPVLVGADADNEGGSLVPIMCLINGTTIERMAVDEVTYWHVELDAHDILLAEGLPVESYLDGGDRPFFGEAGEHALMNPDFVVPGLAGRCRPVAVDGPVVEAERLRLDAVFATRLHAAGAWPSEAAVSAF